MITKIYFGTCYPDFAILHINCQYKVYNYDSEDFLNLLSEMSRDKDKKTQEAVSVLNQYKRDFKNRTLNYVHMYHTPSIKSLYKNDFLGNVYIDMDGVLTPYEYADYENNNWLNHPEILYKEPQLALIPESWIILTKYSTDKEGILKFAWAKEYFPKNKIILVSSTDSKADFIRPHSYDILIDDYNKNIDEWIKAGGCAIKFLNGINSPRADVPCVTL